ncbi:15353_t:CDS:2, partial [Acaulospora colombiana]
SRFLKPNPPTFDPPATIMATSAFGDRPQNKLVLFDVDDTLTLPRQRITPEMAELLKELKKKVVVGFVGGSDLAKISEQLVIDGLRAIEFFDYAFPENGLSAYKSGKPLPFQSFINWLGEEKYKKLERDDQCQPNRKKCIVSVPSILILILTLHSIAERNEFQAYDKEHKLREDFVKVLREKFADYGLTYSIGGQISFDVFPNGWDKTYALRHVENEGFEEIYFFGDKTYKGGNDYEIYSDSRTIGHSVSGPQDTARIVKELFL